MGAHDRRHTVPGPPRHGTRPAAPAVAPTAEAEPSAAAVLGVLARVHSERLGMLRALQVELTHARDLAAVLCEDNGYPALRVARVDGARHSVLVGVTYRRDITDWWYRTPDVGAPWVGPTRDIGSAAAFITRALRAAP